MFFSDNDYYVDLEQYRLFKKNLPGAKYYVVKNAGHFSTSDGYVALELLRDVILGK